MTAEPHAEPIAEPTAEPIAEPLDDLLADDADGHPLVRAARALADGLLSPAAADVDASAVPASHLAAIAGAGLLGLEAPERAGGSAAPGAVRRRVAEVLAGADLATWLVQAQHHGPVRALAAEGERFGTLLADLAAGRAVAGIAFSHLRRWPRRPVTATADGDGGWRIDGVAPWYTGWGLNDVALVSAAESPADGADPPRVVHALVPARPAPGLRASAPLDVVAVRAARTVTLTFESLAVPPAGVVAVEPVRQWLERDAAQAANVSPAVFGVAASALRLLAAEGRRRNEPAAGEAALRLALHWRDARSAAYLLMDGAPAGEQLADRLRLRARAHQMLVDATTALVVAGSGPAMAGTSPAQRKAREGMFLLVQAQTKASRTANLQAIGRPG